MLGKWVNDQLITPSLNERQKIVIANPTDDVLKTIMGYKDVIEAEKPDYDEATQYLQMVKMAETDTTISVGWEVKEIEDELLSDLEVEHE